MQVDGRMVMQVDGRMGIYRMQVDGRMVMSWGRGLDSDEETHNEQPVPHWMRLDEGGVVACRGDGLSSNHQGHCC